jgi:hypothetical protein
MQRNNQSQFYKYLTPESAKLVLAGCSLKWSIPSLFNDPLDNQPELLMHPDVELMAKQSHDHFMSRLLQDSPITDIYNPQLGAVLEYLRQVVKQTGYEHTAEDLEYLREGSLEGERNARARMPEVNQHVKNVLSDISIFCMSEDNANPVMWAHYAANHTGVVLKLVPPHDDSFLTVAQRVNYVDEPVRFTAADFMDVPSAIRKTMDYVTLTKTTAWAYEKEWRVVSGLRNKANHYEIIPFNPQELAAVYLGCRMSPTDQQAIIGLTQVRFPHADILKAKPNQADLTYGFVPVE